METGNSDIALVLRAVYLLTTFFLDPHSSLSDSLPSSWPRYPKNVLLKTSTSTHPVYVFLTLSTGDTYLERRPDVRSVWSLVGEGEERKFKH
jgi:hypothetical protein